MTDKFYTSDNLVHVETNFTHVMRLASSFCIKFLYLFLSTSIFQLKIARLYRPLAGTTRGLEMSYM